ncbi:endonuclease/exonuclease/phosphatase family protein [Streptomyces sp. B21-083]|uniref:endonuclease/exonuclease/phosphatase family protein n=1 Tax=Streptomyces sp. B21-083 TaxID=3039410 RepID=UPI002FF04A50
MRVVTWNLWWRFGPWEARRKAILSVLRELRPDVVGLQEVWECDGENIAAWIADELGLHWTWAPSETPERWQRRIGGEKVDVGNAVLSRWPVVESEAMRLPAPDELDDGRLALYARLAAAPGHHVPFFTTHLTSAAHASEVRRQQVTALAEFVAKRRVGTAYPPVITGDFNAWPDSDEIRLFGGYKTAPAVPGQVPGFGPSARIDYVFVGPPGRGGLGHVRKVERAGHGAVDGIWPSDHAAVVADLASA